MNELITRSIKLPTYEKMVDMGFKGNILDSVILSAGDHDYTLVIGEWQPTTLELAKITVQPPCKYFTLLTNGIDSSQECHFSMTKANAKFKEVYGWLLKALKDKGFELPTYN